MIRYFQKCSGALSSGSGVDVLGRKQRLNTLALYAEILASMIVYVYAFVPMHECARVRVFKYRS